MITFEYQGAPGAAGSDILKPLIPIWIRDPRQAPEQVGLIDTGADDVLIPHYLGGSGWTSATKTGYSMVA